MVTIGNRYIIKGQKTLSGTIEVMGAKNHALKLFPVCILMKGDVIIANVPDIEDVRVMVKIMEHVGAKITRVDDTTYKVNTDRITTPDLLNEAVSKIRASITLAAPMLARFGEVKIGYPGGDVIGRRPIDIFLQGFKALGAAVNQTNGHFVITATGGLTGAEFMFRRITVTGTESMIMAAVIAKGTSVLTFSACEPEVVALCESLVAAGAHIEGIGTQTLTITGSGGELLTAVSMRCIPDRLETGTFAIMGALTGGEIIITHCNPSHVEALWLRLASMGVDFTLGEDMVTIKGGSLKTLPEGELTTHEYPGFATDLQAPFTVMLTQVPGMTLVHETIFEGRLFYVDKLNSMGAHIVICDPHRVIVNGPTKLYGSKMESPDIRAGMGLILAALVAEGKSEIDNVYQVERGYANIVERLRALGADITRQN